MSDTMCTTEHAGNRHWEVRCGVFRGFGHRHLILALAFAIAYNVLGHLGLPDFDPGSLQARLKLFAAIPGYLLLATFALLVAVAMENWLTDPPLQLLRYPLAVLLAAAGAVLISALVEFVVGVGPMLGAHGEPPAAAAGQARHMAPIAGAWVVPAVVAHYLKAAYICALLVALHAIFEANRRASAHLHDAQMQALEADHDVFSDELRAIQARVDPDLLFEALRDIDAAYDIEPAAAQSRLDALIRFLRAALPGDLTANSTIADEKELVEAYVALISFQRPSPAHIEFIVDSALLALRLPPMILLPLARWALGDGTTADRLRLTVKQRDDGQPLVQPRLEIVVDGPADRKPGRAEEELTTLRDRLQRFYGTAARCSDTSDGTQRRAVVELPGDRAGPDGAETADDRLAWSRRH